MIMTDVRGSVGYVILNRVDKKNALNEAMVGDMYAAFEDLAVHEKVRVVIIRSNSDVFSAGADLAYLQSLQTNSYEENLADSNRLKALFEMIYNYPKITIAQVEGHAIAGGCGLATVTDFTYAVPEAKMGYTEVKIGFIPALVSVFLIRKLGEVKAKELLLTGKLIDADEAKSIHLINDVIDNVAIGDYVYKMAVKLAETTSAESIRQTKKLMDEVRTMTFSDGMNLAAEYNAKMRESPDCKRGIQAFLDKEKIKWDESKK